MPVPAPIGELWPLWVKQLTTQLENSICSLMAAVQPERPVVRPRLGLAAGISSRRQSAAVGGTVLPRRWRTREIQAGRHVWQLAYGQTLSVSM